MTAQPNEETHPVELMVNGHRLRTQVPGRRLLSDCLRHDLGLTGTHVGCEQGFCGACTILLDGQPVRSCLVFAVTADGHEVTTVEGLADPAGQLHPLQQAFLDHRGFQCGFCTPGMLLAAVAWLRDHHEPTADAVRDALAGILCRCTGYDAIVASVLQAARTLNPTLALEDTPPPDETTSP
ncbi:(2Fe-2S)-binding protein [Streptomyces sp. NPDC127051]|uniref:(2Fe-2S)-binding protein n=1 Tax=Streptomyces sp. NPDC127051 TaxID=3347119 RepID=UPI00366717D1